MEDRHENKQPKQNNDHKKGDRSKGKPGRDPRGVRINNYNESMRGRYTSEKATDTQTRVLLETFNKNITQETTTPEGVTVERTGPGRPPKYPTLESFLNVVKEYSQYIMDVWERDGVELIPDIEGFCAFAGIDRWILNEWEKSRPPEYSHAIKAFKNNIAAYKKQLGFAGRIPPIVLAMDFNNNHGYVQQNKLDINTNIRIEELPSADDIARRLPSGD